MKILHVMAGAKDGGAEIFFADAIAALHSAGVEQMVVTRPDNNARVAQIRSLGISVETTAFHTIFRWPTAACIRKAIHQFQPDIVQYWMSRSASFCVAGNHVNIGWHSSYFKLKRFAKCDAHIGVTEDVRRHIIAQGVAPEKVFSLPIYTPKHDAVPIARAEFDTPEGVPLLLSLARLHPVKGLDVLLESLRALPEAYLWMAGSGPLEAELKAQCHDLGLDDRVRFLGWREDKDSLMAAADVCVFPSRNDSFGAVMIEAWAHGTPIVAAKAPGPKAYIHHEQDGLLVEIDDAAGLADAIHRVISAPDLRDRLIKNGAVRFENEFSQEAFLRNAMAIYGDLLDC